MIWEIVAGVESVLLFVVLPVRLLKPKRDEPQPPEPPAAAVVGPDERIGHLDAVAAQCLVSPLYAELICAAYEPEVTDLLELALEVDDVRPAPGIPRFPAEGEAGAP